MVGAHDTSLIVSSLVANLIIAVGKGVAAALTKSGTLLAEAIHSLADCGNQALLLFGVKRALRPPDAAHPLGYGRALYFWSFMVALLLFTGGGVFSLYEGLHKIRHPEPIARAWIGFVVLGGALLIEGWATLGNLRELKRRRGQTPLFRYLRSTKDSDLVVVFGENSAAVLGLGLAMAALALSVVTGDARWDGVGSLAIGVVLVGVAVFLAIEVKALLIGESADPELVRVVHEVVAEDARFEGVLQLVTVQQGPGEVVVAMKVKFASGLAVDEVCAAINEFERRLRARAPEARWVFVEPDLAPAVAAA